ncbi:MAG: LysM peptidoglycan-binding domain-containing protein [Deltaproteobacteria bacterium]|nr:LysM peptidoglycan-binding domain-containing protein [Deltaproteobacteria bacterium]
MTIWKGREIIDVAIPHVGEDYVFGARAPLDNANWRGPWDCAEFTSWCAYQAYGVVFGAYGSDPRTADPYSGKWYEDGKRRGTLIGMDQALNMPGAIIGRSPGNNRGHVAISLGAGRTVEARGKRYGVVITENAQNRRWDFGVLIPGVAYDTFDEDLPPREMDGRILRVESPYMRGEDVLSVQRKLASLGIDPGDIDGIYGENSETAVAAFQLKEGLNVDGEVGLDTAKALGLGWPIHVVVGEEPVPNESYSIYRVVSGDTFNTISKKLGLTLDELVAANPGINDINRIEIGDILRVPTRTASTLEDSPGTTGEDIYSVEILAKTIYGEARGEPVEGQHAVGFVVLNRVASDSWYGGTVVEVCLKPWQFSTWNPNTPSRRMLDQMDVSDKRLAPQVRIAREVLDGTVSNLVAGATHYHADYVHPAWVSGATRVATVGHHLFYKNVP